MLKRYLPSIISIGIILTLASAAPAAAPRVLPEGQLPKDIRLEPPKDLDGYFPFATPKTKAEWDNRAERVRRQILVSQGLFPMPTKTPLNAVIHGKIDRGEYTVEKVYFESSPGFFVTGNLYRPKNISGKVPGVLFAHGHWTDARLSFSSESELRGEIADGAERFEQGGRSRFQSMCVQLARMGCVVWQWDMLGNSDSQQLSMALVHRFAKQRPEMNTTENWGLYSPQAETHLQSIMGLQTWNGIRSLDFLLSLPEVDPARIAMTGASGGGTQTMLLSAIDPRVTLSFPAVMVSTSMQGGCTCENACLLRVDTGNVEFAALFAPKPQGMTCANDWTKEMSTKGFPQLQELYAMLGAKDKVMLKRGEHFPHNYNAVSRGAFYTWLNRHFKLGQKEPVIERDYEPLSKEQLTVWDAQHPAPKANDPDFERKLLRAMNDDAQNQLAAAAAASPESFRKTCGAALDIVLGGRDISAESRNIEFVKMNETDRGAWTLTTGLIRNNARHEELPAVFCSPKSDAGRSDTPFRRGAAHNVLWLGAQGKSALFTADGSLQPEVERLVKSGCTVMGIDLLYQGEFLADGKPLATTPRVKNPRESAAYTFGYNYSLFVHRVHDILTAASYLKKTPQSRLTVVDLDGAGPLVAAARAIASAPSPRYSGERVGVRGPSPDASPLIDAAVINTNGFRFASVLDLGSESFLPGGAKYGDVPAMLALGAPGRTFIAGETAQSLALAQSQYDAAKASKNLTRFTGDPAQLRAAAVEWILTCAVTKGVEFSG